MITITRAMDFRLHHKAVQEDWARIFGEFVGSIHLDRIVDTHWVFMMQYKRFESGNREKEGAARIAVRLSKVIRAPISVVKHACASANLVTTVG